MKNVTKPANVAEKYSQNRQKKLKIKKRSCSKEVRIFVGKVGNLKGMHGCQNMIVNVDIKLVTNDMSRPIIPRNISEKVTKFGTNGLKSF